MMIGEDDAGNERPNEEKIKIKKEEKYLQKPCMLY